MSTPPRGEKSVGLAFSLPVRPAQTAIPPPVRAPPSLLAFPIPGASRPPPSSMTSTKENLVGQLKRKSSPCIFATFDPTSSSQFGRSVAPSPSGPFVFGQEDRSGPFGMAGGKTDSTKTPVQVNSSSSFTFDPVSIAQFGRSVAPSPSGPFVFGQENPSGPFGMAGVKTDSTETPVNQKMPPTVPIRKPLQRKNRSHFRSARSGRKRVINPRKAANSAAGQSSTSALIPKEEDQTPMPVWPYQYLEYSKIGLTGLPYSRPKLRFKAGDLVQAFVASKKCDHIAQYMILVGQGQGKWINGNVVKVWEQRTVGNTQTLMPYYIELEDGGNVWLPEDTNRCVRDASRNTAAQVIQQYLKRLRRSRTKLRNAAAKVIQQSLRRRTKTLRNAAAKVIQSLKHSRVAVSLNLKHLLYTKLRTEFVDLVSLNSTSQFLVDQFVVVVSQDEIRGQISSICNMDDIVHYRVKEYAEDLEEGEELEDYGAFLHQELMLEDDYVIIPVLLRCATWREWRNTEKHRRKCSWHKTTPPLEYFQNARLYVVSARRLLQRSLVMVEGCVQELIEIWNDKLPRDSELSSFFETCVAKHVVHSQSKMESSSSTSDTARQILQQGNGLMVDLNVYENRIRDWRQIWTDDDLFECPCCSEWMQKFEQSNGYKDALLVLQSAVAEEKEELEQKMETKINDSQDSCNHGNNFCSTCLKDYFRGQMLDPNGVPPMNGLMCPMGCGKVIDDAVLAKLFGNEFKNLVITLNTTRIKKRPNKRFCPNGGCKYMQLVVNF
jgi:hypothetical protein